MMWNYFDIMRKRIERNLRTYFRMLGCIFVFTSYALSAEAQQVAVKTNLLYWATTTPNLGVEVQLQKKWTIDISGTYNPSFFSTSGTNDPKFYNWILQPEVRYWFSRSFEGGYLGAQGIYGKYDIGGIPFVDRYYEGELRGGGLSYGYHWAFGKRWGIEANASVGYVYLKYFKYDESNSEERGNQFYRNYFGPVRIGFSVIYFLK